MKQTLEFFTVPSTGQKVRIRALTPDVKRQLDELRDSLPKAPTYTVTYAGGETEQVPHDPTTLETDEEKVAWQKFLVAYNEASTVVTGRWAMAIALLCILELEYPDGWKSDFEYLGIEIPEDSREERIFFINNVLLPTDQDKEDFAETVWTISTIRREDLANAGLEFRDMLPQYTAEEIEIGGVAVDDLAPLFGSTSNGSVEHNSERVGQFESV